MSLLLNVVLVAMKSNTPWPRNFLAFFQELLRDLHNIWIFFEYFEDPGCLYSYDKDFLLLFAILLYFIPVSDSSSSGTLYARFKITIVGNFAVKHQIPFNF